MPPVGEMVTFINTTLVILFLLLFLHFLGVFLLKPDNVIGSQQCPSPPVKVLFSAVKVRALNKPSDRGAPCGRPGYNVTWSDYQLLHLSTTCLWNGAADIHLMIGICIWTLLMIWIYSKDTLLYDMHIQTLPALHKLPYLPCLLSSATPECG